MRRRKTDPVSQIVGDMISRLDPGGHRYESKAVQVWPEVAGQEIARHTRGFALRDGELVVFVDSAAWANELSLMSERLRDGINSRVGQDLVRSIRFTVSKIVRQEVRREAAQEDEEAFYAPDPHESVPLTSEERAQAAYIAEAVQDSELRETALRVMIKDLERKKGERAVNASQRATEGVRDTDSSA